MNFNDMGKITGSEAVIKCLLEEGANIIYGYPGGAIMPVYDELFKYVENKPIEIFDFFMIK